MNPVNRNLTNLNDVTGDVGEMMTMPEVAKILRVAPRTLRKYIGTGAIPSHLYSRAGGYAKGRLRFTADQVRQIANIWAGVNATPAPPQRNGSAYAPRRRA